MKRLVVALFIEGSISGSRELLNDLKRRTGLTHEEEVTILQITEHLSAAAEQAHKLVNSFLQNGKANDLHELHEMVGRVVPQPAQPLPTLGDEVL